MKRKWDRFHMWTTEYKKQDILAVYFLIGIFLFFLSLFIFSGFIEDYIAKENWKFDLIAIHYMNRIRNEMLNHIFKGITSTGNVLSIVMITFIIAGILIYLKRKRQALFFSLNILGLWLFNEGLKQIFKRPRPLGLRLVQASGYSFPSGHSMIFMGLSTLIIYYILSDIHNKKIAIPISLIILIYAILVGFSRIYVGVHYLSDVLAGWTTGVLWSLSSIFLYKKLKDKRILS